MEIAIIGAGSVGAALARGWSRSNHGICIGVRDVENRKYRRLLEQTAARAASVAEAAQGGDIVVLALPWTAAESAVAKLGDLSGKIVIDCMNPLVVRGGVLGLDRGFSTSGGERVAAWLPGARVVKTLNQVGAEVMEDASGFAVPPAMFMAGDDDAAKSTVAGLLRDLGFDPLDAGGLAQSRLLEPLAMVWINQAVVRGKGRDWAFGAMQRAR